MIVITNFVIEKFLKNKPREYYGKFAGIIGIISNVLLFIIKLTVGLFASSLSIITDAVNNLSDSASSLITLLGFKFSEMPPDEEHPYGHARIEYISGLIVAFIVVLVGIQFFVNSVKKIIKPTSTEFNLIFATILIISILIKIWQSGFYKNIGNKINSKVIIATSIDSRNDVFITIIILISSIAEYYSGLMLDGIIGAFASIFLIYSGVELVKDIMTPLIGQAPKKELVENIKQKILSYNYVLDLHDLLIHYYGPDRIFASVNVEIPATIDIMLSHEVIDQIERDMLKDMGIKIVIHLDPIAVNDPEQLKLQTQVENITKNIDNALSIHDFRLIRRKDYTRIIFDVTIPSEVKIADQTLRKLYLDEIYKINNNFEVVVIIDRNYSSTID